MENGPMASGDPNLPRLLTDADFQAFSLEVAQARADAQGHGVTNGELSFPGMGAVSDWTDDGLIPCTPEAGWQADDGALTGTPARTPGSSSPNSAMTQASVTAEDFAPIHCNLSLAELMEHALLRAEGVLSDRGALCVKTLPYGGTTAGSYYVVEPGLSQAAAIERGKAQRAEPLTPGLQLAPMDEKTFWALYQRAMDYGEDKALYQWDGWVELGLPGQATGIRVICELASQAIMARHWLCAATTEAEEEQLEPASLTPAEPLTHLSLLEPGLKSELQPELRPGLSPSPSDPSQNEQPTEVDNASDQELTVIVLNGLKGEPWVEPLLETEVFVAIYPAQGLALVGGSRHGGDLLGAIASLLSEVQDHRSTSGLLLQDAVHCLGTFDQPSALFLGEVGSGKQTLASTLGRTWQRGPMILQPADGLEASPQLSLSQTSPLKTLPPKVLSLKPLLSGGYGNVSGLTAQDALHQHLTFGAVLENVPLQAASSRPRFNDVDSSLPFRGAWQDDGWESAAGLVSGLRSSPDHPGPGQIAPPKIFLLVADTAGVLPAIARLTREQAVYYFALGYGSELPGWSRHQLHPTAQFKAMDPPRALRDALRWQACLQAQAGTEVYLVNTGWLGPLLEGERSLQQRIPVSISQTLIQAAIAGEIPWARPGKIQTQSCLDPLFGWTLPLGLQQLPGRWCQPWNCWSNTQQWRVAAIALGQQFQVQMAGLVAAGLPGAIAQAGPRLPHQSLA